MCASPTDRCCDTTSTVQGNEESSASFSCTYEPENKDSEKYFCRGNQPSRCLQNALITSPNQQNGRFSLTDDKASRRFTLTITSLTKQDAGSYVCGVHRNTGLDLFEAFELAVQGETSSLTIIYVMLCMLISQKTTFCHVDFANRIMKDLKAKALNLHFYDLFIHLFSELNRSCSFVSHLLLFHRVVLCEDK